MFTAVEFLHECAATEKFDLGKDVVVVGGGNVAIDAARVARRCGGKNVQMFCLEARNEMPAADYEIEEAEEDGVKINCSWGPKEIIKKKDKVKAIVFKKCVQVKDEQGRFAPVYDEDDTITVECDNVILSIGQSIVWGNLLDGATTIINKNGTLQADEKTLQTAQEDIFVGGDAYTGPRFAIDAIATGKEAAISIHRFVQPHSSLTIGRNPRYYVELDKDDIVLESYDNSSRQIPQATKQVKELGFRDDDKFLTEEQVKTETARCLGCGATIVDKNRCVGCGICTTKCEFDAIKIVRERPNLSLIHI